MTGYLVFATLFWGSLYGKTKDVCCFIQAEKDYCKLFSVLNEYQISTSFVRHCDRKKAVSFCIIKIKYQWFSQVSDFNVHIFWRFITYEHFDSVVD